MQTAPHKLAEANTPAVPLDGQFNFALPMHVFEKASAPEGKKRRFGGICSTDRSDRQGERILQDGLDWGDFFEHGWFNDNHSAKTADVLGYGDKGSLIQFKPGDLLPDGTEAVCNGTWVEGYLLDRPAADQIWDLAQSLQGTGRSLGFSVEGNIVKRTGAGNKTIAKAKIRNVAITNCPVNTDARLEILARSLEAIERQAAEEQAAKAMGGAGALVPLADAQGTGRTAGRIIAVEALEGDLHPNGVPGGKRKAKKKKRVAKSLTLQQAVAYVQARVPGLGYSKAKEVVMQSGRLAKGGEGSKGGHIIGHTKSGKAVYGEKHGKYANLQKVAYGKIGASDQLRHNGSEALHNYPEFSVQDHKDAVHLHLDEAAKHAPPGVHRDSQAAGAHHGAWNALLKQAKKSLTPAQAIAYLQARAPGLTHSNALRMLKASKALQHAGLI